MSKQPCVYILASKRNGTIYVGVTSNLAARIDAHRRSDGVGFTARYQVKTLVYLEVCENMAQAIEREKQIKARSRKYKVMLIERNNPLWEDIGYVI